MAELKITSTELIGLIKQNADLPKEFTNIYADGNGVTAEIDAPIVGRRSLYITYQSFSNDILTCKIAGKGLLDKLVCGLLAPIGTFIKAFNRNAPADELIRVNGDLVLINMSNLVKKVKGLKIDEVLFEGGNITVDMVIQNVDDSQEIFEEVAAGRTTI